MPSFRDLGWDISLYKSIKNIDLDQIIDQYDPSILRDYLEHLERHNPN